MAFASSRWLFYKRKLNVLSNFTTERRLFLCNRGEVTQSLYRR